MLTRRLFTRAALAAPVALASAGVLAAESTPRPPQLGDEVAATTPDAWWSLPVGTLVSAEYKAHRRWYLTNGQRGAYIGTMRLQHNGTVHGGFYEPWLDTPGIESPERYIIRALGLPYIPHNKEADAAVARAIAPFVKSEDKRILMTWTQRDTDPNAIVAAFNKFNAQRAAEPIRQALATVRPR